MIRKLRLIIIVVLSITIVVGIVSLFVIPLPKWAVVTNMVVSMTAVIASTVLSIKENHDAKKNQEQKKN